MVLKCLRWLLLLGAAGIGLWIVSDTLRTIAAIHYESLYLDQWETLYSFYAYQEVNRFPQWFFAFHNEHQILLPRLLFLVDWFFFGAANRFLVAFILGVQFAWMLGYFYILRKEGVSRRECLCVAGGAGILLFSATQLENLSWGFQVQFVLVFLLAGLAFYGYFHYLKEQRLFQLVWAMGAALAAALTMSNGMLCWLLMIAVSLLLRRWRLLLILLGGFLLCLVIALTGEGMRSASAADLLHSLVSEPLSTLMFMAVYMGNPLGKLSFPYAIAWSLLCFGYTALLGFHLWRKRLSPSAATWTLFATLAFIVVTSLATALGRLEQGLLQATSERYTTPAMYGVAILWVLTFLPMFQSGSSKWLRAGMIVWLAGLVLMGSYLLHRQDFYTFHYGIKHWKKLIALDAIQNGVANGYYLPQVHPNWSFHLQTARKLRSNRTFQTVHVFQEDRLEAMSILDSVVNADPEAWLVPLESIDEADRGYMAYGDAIVSIEHLHKRLWLKSGSGVWVGSGYFMRAFERIWPMDQHQLREHAVRFVTHLQGAWTGDEVFLYVETRGGLQLLGSLRTHRVSMQEMVHFVNPKPLDWRVENLSKDKTWTRDGVFPNVLSGNRDFQVWGSWSGDDLGTGSIRFDIIPEGGTKMITLPYVSGPVNPNGRIEMWDADTGERFFSWRPSSHPEKWTHVGIPLPPGAMRIRVEVSENGAGWGQWIGIGLPKGS